MTSLEHPLSACVCITPNGNADELIASINSVAGWASEIYVCCTSDDPQLIQRQDLGGAAVLSSLVDHAEPLLPQVRQELLARSNSDWFLFLDANERVPQHLLLDAMKFLGSRGQQFNAVIFPVKYRFLGQELDLKNLWTSYMTPQLVHRTVLRDGLEPDNWNCVVFSHENNRLAMTSDVGATVTSYLSGLNNRTDIESRITGADQQNNSWRAQIATFVNELHTIYDHSQGVKNGYNGLLFAFLSGLERMLLKVKVRERVNQEADEDPDNDLALPSNAFELVDFMQCILSEGAIQWLHPRRRDLPMKDGRLPLLWTALFFDTTGYADEARTFVLGLIRADANVAISPMWFSTDSNLAAADLDLLETRVTACDSPAVVHVMQAIPPLLRRSPNAIVSVARTMFEADRLQDGWANRLNKLDRVWVPSEFNKRTFAESGVDSHKIAVIPGSLDTSRYTSISRRIEIPGSEPFKFLSVFTWSLRKGWDVLLEAFVREFGPDSEVGLVIKTSGVPHGKSIKDLHAEADAFLKQRVGCGLSGYPNIHIWENVVPVDDMPQVYHAANAFVLATRGEGWCRPLMESMAAGLPAVATGCGGITQFFDATVGFPVSYTFCPVSPEGVEETQFFQGLNLAEPDLNDLRSKMRFVVANYDAACSIGTLAQRRIVEQFDQSVVTSILEAEIRHCMAIAGVEYQQAVGLVATGTA